MVTVAEVMTANLVTITPDASLREARDQMITGHFSRLPVIYQGKLVGIISDRDLRRATNSPLVLQERWYDAMILDQLTVLGTMTPDPVIVRSDTPLLEAATLIQTYKIGGLPVVNYDVLVGIITQADLIAYLIKLLAV